MTFERWIDRPGRDVRACVLSRPYEFASPFGGEPFVLLLVVVDPTVTPAERDVVSDQIVGSGCRYVCATAHECSEWDDSVDMSDIARDPEFQPQPETFVMTSWHDGDPLADVVDFAFDCTNFAGNVFTRYLVAFVGDDPKAWGECQALVRRRGDQPPTK